MFLKGRIGSYVKFNSTAIEPNRSSMGYITRLYGCHKTFPSVDVSGSMTCKAGGYNSKSDLTCLDVAVSFFVYTLQIKTSASSRILS
jgi:hypothetical protein